jgi:hypothetical protein
VPVPLAAAGESAACLRRHAEVTIEAMAEWNRGHWAEPMSASWRASAAMVQGLRALDQRRFADAADTYRLQAALYREEVSEFR